MQRLYGTLKQKIWMRVRKSCKWWQRRSLAHAIWSIHLDGFDTNLFHSSHGFFESGFLVQCRGWWNEILWFFVIAWMAWCGIQQICSFNEGVVDTSHVLPSQARGEQSEWIAIFPWDEDNCCRWVLGIGNNGWLTALHVEVCIYNIDFVFLFLSRECFTLTNSDSNRKALHISVPIMMDPYHQSFEEFPNRPRTPGAKAHKYVRALYHALSRAILGVLGSQEADPSSLQFTHGMTIYTCTAQVISSFTKGIVPSSATL